MAQNDIKVSVGLDQASITQITRQLKMAVIQGTDLDPADFSKVIGSLKSAIKEVEKGSSSMAKPLAEAMKRSVSFMEQAFKKGTAGSHVMQRQLEDMIRTLGRVSSASQKTGANFEKHLDRSIMRSSQSINRSQRQLTATTQAETRKREQAYRREQRALETTFNKSFMARLQHAAKTVAAYSAIGSPLMIVRRSLMESARREQSLQDAFAMGMGGSSGIFSSFERFSVISTEIANNSGLAADEVDKLSLAMAQAGITGRGSETVLRGMADAIRLSFGQMDPKLAIQGFNAIKNTFYSSADAADQYSMAMTSLNKAIALSNVAASDPRQIIEAITKIGAGAGIAGFDPETLSALLIGATERSGVATPQFATALRRTLPRLDARRTRETLEGQFGIEYVDPETGRNKSQMRILEAIAAKYKDLMDQGREYEVSQMAVSAAGTVRYNDFIKILESYMDINERKQKADEESLRMQEKIAEANDSINKTIERTWNEVTRVGTGFIKGSYAVDSFRGSLEGVTSTLNNLDATQSAVFGDMLLGLGTLSGAKALGLGGTAIGAGKGALALGSAAIAIPALTVMAAAVYLNADNFKDLWGELSKFGFMGQPDHRVSPSQRAGFRARAESLHAAPLIEKVIDDYITSQSPLGMGGKGIFSYRADSDLVEQFKQSLMPDTAPLARHAAISDFIRGSGSELDMSQDIMKQFFDSANKRFGYSGDKSVAGIMSKTSMLDEFGAEEGTGFKRFIDNFKENIGEMDAALKARADVAKDMISSDVSGVSGLEDLSRRATGLISLMNDFRDGLRAGETDIDSEQIRGVMSGIPEQIESLKSQLKGEDVSEEVKGNISRIINQFRSIMRTGNDLLKAMERKGARASNTMESSNRKAEAEDKERLRKLDAAIKKNNKSFEDFMGAKVGAIESEAIAVSQMIIRKDSQFSQDWMHVSENIDITTEGIRNSLQDLTVGLLGSAMDQVDKLGVSALSDGMAKIRNALNSAFTAESTQSKFNAMKMHKASGDLMASVMQAGFGTSAHAAGLGSLMHSSLGSPIGQRGAQVEQERILKESLMNEREAIEWAKKSADHLDSIDSKTGHVENSIKGLLSGAMMGKVDVKGFWGSLMSPLVEGRSGTGANALTRIQVGGGLSLGDYLTAIVQPGGIQQVESEHAAIRSASDPTYAMGMQVMQAMGGPGAQQQAIQMASVAMGKKALKSGVFGASTTKALSGLGDLVTGFSYITAAKEILKSAGIGATKVKTDQRQMAQDTNTAVSGLYDNLKDNALNFVQDDMMRIFGYTPSYDTINKSSDRRGGLHGLLGGKNVQYVSDFSGARSLEQMKKMEYDSIISAAQFETDMRFRELDIMRDKLEKIRLMVSIASDSNIELDKLASAEAEGIAIRAKMMDSITDSVANAIQMSTNMASAFATIRKYSTDGSRSLIGISQDPNDILSMSTQMATQMVKSAYMDVSGDLPMPWKASTGTDIIRAFSQLQGASEHLFEFGSTDINQMVSDLPDLLEWAMKPGAGDWQMKLVDLAVDMVNLQRSVVGELISISESGLGESAYLAGMEVNQKSISEVEEKTGKKFEKFATDMLSGDMSSVGGEDWTYRIRDMRDRYSAIESFIGGGISSNLSALWNPAVLEGILEGSNKSPEEIEYAKSLISGLASTLLGAFGTMADSEPRGTSSDEDSAMYQVGSTGKYYITQNFVVESTYFGGSQNDAVQFLKFLSKAWNSVGDKNMTGKLF